MKWLISYRYNGKVYDEKFAFLFDATLRMIQLEAYDLAPTLHEL